MTSIKLAIRALKRDWRAGELRILVGAVVIAVTCVTAVVFFTDRIGLALRDQASDLIGADLRVVMDHQVDKTLYSLASDLQLDTATTLNFRSMVLNGQANRLAEIKAVSNTYPLRGALRISKSRFGPGKITSAIPELGTVWVEPTLLTQLQLQMGDNVRLGDSVFRIAAVITYEADRSGDMFSIAPRVMLNLKDLPATQLVQEGSRIQYRLLVAGDADNVAKFRNRLEPNLKAGERIESVKDARREVRFALERAQQFLGLAALVSLILSCIAIAMSARRYAERHLDTCAIMRCVGASQAQITSLFSIQIILLGLIASIVGCFLGFLCQSVLVKLLGNLLLVSLPTSTFVPIISGMAVGLVGLLGFAAPPILRLKDVPTLRVLRRDLGAMRPLSVSSYIFGLLILGGLLLWLAGDEKLGIYIILGIMVSVIILVLFTKLLIYFLGYLPTGNNLAWRFGVNNITRRPASSIVQVLAFGIGIMVLLLLTLVRGDILGAWEQRLPEDASNRFVINIQPDQVRNITEYFQHQGLGDIKLYPMVRARLKSINEQTVNGDSYESERAKNLVRREFNLSWTDVLQDDNKIVDGDWWLNSVKNTRQISMEQGIAKTLGVKVGDTMSYVIAGDELEVTVSSLRTVQWDTFKPNFFVLTPPGTLDSYPASYITSFYLSSENHQLLDNLINAFPNLTVVDISAIMAQIRKIINRVALAVEYVFLFTLIAGLMVLYAAIQATRDERTRENAILRAIGAGKSRLIKSIVTEFCLIGALAGIMASLSASILGYVITVYILKLDYSFNPLIVIFGVLAGTLGIGIAGAMTTRSVLARPPIQVLRET